ncbi:MAG TPA: lamin tail domain-containing protein, partial [Methylomirabilota bacterium]|nr:lamin tail domain-containing protein [Methylomirabilota bacterium]
MLNSYTCIFLRREFAATNVGAVVALQLDYFIDDGFVAWINGVEVFRVNVPAGEVTRTTLATNQPADPAPWESVRFPVPAGLLREGANLLAVQAFNTSSGSSDFGFDCALTSLEGDSTPPTILSVSPPPGEVNALTQIMVTFSEPVTGVNADDFYINSQPASGVTGSGTTYTFTFGQPLYGHVAITWFGDHGIQDQAFVPNPFDATAPGATWSYTLIDDIHPEVVSLFPSPGTTVRTLGQIEVTFSEEVNGVQAEDLLINGQPATSVSRLGGGPYVFQFPTPAPGPVQVRWRDGHGITDQATAPNPFAGGNWTYTYDPDAPAGDLVITEILASNQNGLVDEDGEPQDWIEIYNRGAGPVDLVNWSLSDDPEIPGLWTFPSRTLAPGAYLVVFASGKDRKPTSASGRLHTNFKLGRGPDHIGLYTPDSPRALASGFDAYPEQRNDHSYGFDSGGNLRYFATPTPGAPNGASAIVGVVEPVHFSVSRGFFSNAFTLTLSTPTPGARILYTTDGSEPTLTTGIPFVQSLRITNTTLLRAAAFKNNFLPSTVGTHSYLFHLTPSQRTLPILNLVTATNNLIGRNGILGMGGGSRASDNLFITNNPATDYHNPSAHGIAWERPVSVEYIVPEDNSGFQIDAGIRVQGSDYQRPRLLPSSKFSFRLYFRGEYGQGTLQYPLFPLSTVDTFDQLVLRAGFNEQANPFIRDEITRRLSHDMGQVAPHGSLWLVLLNGAVYTNNPSPTPVYNPCERVHEEMLRAHLGGGEDWDVVAPSFATSASGPGVVDGDRNEFNNFMNFIWN